jgi:hypothetical protein
MKIRILAAIPFALVGMVLTLYAAWTPDAVYRSVEKSQRLEREFREVGEITQAFRREHGRLPTDKEFSAVVPPSRSGSYQVVSIDRLESECLERKPNINLQKITYYLWYWRGEWIECYYPETGESSLVFDSHSYAASGHIWVDSIVIGALAGLCFLLSWMLVRNIL